jgi:hypothetical protein
LTTHSRARRFASAALVTVIAACGALLVGVAPGAGAASTNTLSVTAGEYAYVLKGKPQPGWLQMQFKNGGVEDHMLVMFPLKSGVTEKQLKAAVLANDDAAFGKIVTGDPVSGTPGVLGPNTATATITTVKAGHYGLMCFVAAPDGELHAAHGMIKVFDIKGSKSSYKPPQDGVVDVTLTDTAITVPASPAPRHVTVKVTNEGSDSHSFQLIKLNTGQTVDAALAYFDALINNGTASGTAPGTLVGGVSTVAPNGIAYLELDLVPGHYGYVSVEGDPPNDDASKGLKGEFDVK